MKKRIVITGATGLIGSGITEKLIARGDEVIVFSRSPKKAEKKIPGAFNYVKWQYDSMGEWVESIEGADTVIHLAGENIMSNRWNDAHKKKVLDSRVAGTRNLVDAIAQAEKKPEVFICASGIDYYDDSIEAEYDEESEPGEGFLTNVVKSWEDEAAKVEQYDVRRISIRTGIVLDKQEGALAKMITPFKFFIGGPIGSGKQWMPWIHIEDIVELYIYTLDNSEMKGAYNGTVPSPVTMKEFAKTLGEVMNRPSLFPVPAFVLRIVIGEAADLVLYGSRVLPKKTLEAGYKFNHTDLKKALEQII